MYIRIFENILLLFIRRHGLWCFVVVLFSKLSGDSIVTLFETLVELVDMLAACECGIKQHQRQHAPDILKSVPYTNWCQGNF